MNTVVFKMENFTCPSCVNQIEMALSKLVGVKKVIVLFNTSKVKIEFDGVLERVKEYESILTELGYPIKAKMISG